MVKDTTESDSETESLIFLQKAHLQQPRLEVGIDEDVISVELEAVLVVYYRLLHREKRSARALTP